MLIPQVNWLAVLCPGIVIFRLGGLWYSPALFARKWVVLMGKTEEELKAGASGALPYVFVFVCGLLTALVLAIVMNHFKPLSALRGAEVGAICWLGFTSPSSFAPGASRGPPRGLWV